jgi:hypothetical protein
LNEWIFDPQGFEEFKSPKDHVIVARCNESVVKPSAQFPAFEFGLA